MLGHSLRVPEPYVHTNALLAILFSQKYFLHLFKSCSHKL